MKKQFLKYLKLFIEWLLRKYDYLNKEDQFELPYVSLSPIDNADINKDYKKSLNWALDNKKKYDIKITK